MSKAQEESYEVVAFSGNVEFQHKNLDEFVNSLEELCKKYARDGSEYHFKFA